jgi:branched-chain amino acid transport system substrate-binding protein
MSGHEEKPPKTKADIYITSAIFILLIILFIAAFHPFGTFLAEDFPKDEVVVAASLPFEGEMAEFGIEYQRGIDLAADDINKNGGIRGVPLKVVYYDNKGNKTLAIEQFKEIRDQGIPVVIGALSSTVTLALAPYAETYEILLVSPAATSASLSAYKNYVYRTVSSDIYLGAGMAKIVAGKNSTQDIMILCVDTSYGKSLKSAFINEVNASYSGMHIVSTIMVPDSDKINATEIIEEMKKTNPESVLLIINPSQAVTIMKEAEKEGLDPQWYGSDTITNRQIPEEVGKYADGLIGFSQARRISDPTYEEKYVEKYGEQFIVRDSIYGYDTMMVIAEAIENSGYTADGIIDALSGIRYVGLTGAIVFDESGDAYPSYDVMKLENGVWDDIEWKEILSFDSKSSESH